VVQVKRELEHRWQVLGDFVREQRRLGEMSLRQLSELSGVSNPYLSQIERGLRRPSADILQQLARALEVSAETLYVRAGILDSHDEPSGLTDAIRRAPELTEPQKRTLIHIYASFRSTQDPRQAEPDTPSDNRPGESAGTGEG
jgi:transcriptional regulator with XRE-family HTH domain